MGGLGGHYAKCNKSDSERQILCNITYMWNLKKYNKLVKITKKKQSHRYREQTSGYQWGAGKWKGKYRRGGLRDTNYYVKNKLQVYVVQHTEYSQYFITINGV